MPPKEIISFLRAVQPIKDKYRKEEPAETIGFNVFSVISDVYYKENFHSQFIAALFSKNYHSEAQLFLNQFINCLNTISDNQINPDDFLESIIETEKSKIDIRIRNTASKKSIIIENKINNAIDQPNQIPRYYESEIKEGFIVVGIVYLTLTSEKEPDKRNWDNKSIDRINSILIKLSASKNEKVNLVSSWIDKCIDTSINIDLKAVLKQYKHLICELRNKEMNQMLIEEFYFRIQEEENYSTALSVREYLAHLGEFRAINIKRKFEDQAKDVFTGISSFPYEKVYRAKFQDSRFRELDFWIDIPCYERKTEVIFLESKTYDGKTDRIRVLLEKLGVAKQFKQHPDLKQMYVCEFGFPKEENELMEFLQGVFTNLKQIQEPKP